MTKLEIKQLLRISECSEGRLASNNSLVELSRRFNLGTLLARHLLVKPADIMTARRLLLAHGVDHQVVTSTTYGTATTGADALSHGKYEKHVSQAVKHARVSIKSLPGRSLNLGDEKILFRKRCHLDIALTEVNAVEHDSFLVVENYEAFDDIHRVAIDMGSLNPLVVYRGDPSESRADFVNQLLHKFGFPVYVFGDLDPRGLVIAGGLPNFSGLLLPRDEDLEHMLSGVHRRGDLYLNQITGANRILEETLFSSICHAWGFIKKHRGGLVQQVWLGKSYNLSVKFN